MLINSIKPQNKTTSNPAELYIKSLQSKTSKILMASRLNIISKMIEKSNTYKNTDWSILNYEFTLDIIENLKKEDKAPTTINSYLAAIKGTAKQAWKSEVISTNTYLWINDVKDITGNRTEKGRSLKISEIQKLISTCKNDIGKSGNRDAVIISISYGAGLRRDEAANLKLKDYDRENGTITIKGKGNKERKNKINRKIQKTINHWIDSEQAGNEFLFCKIKNELQTSKRISGNDIYKLIIKRYKQANIEKISPHDLRRTYATKLLENGEDLFIIQELMGHASVNTTKKYDKRSDDFKNKAAELLHF